jgi:hypothetical protein
MGRRDRNRWRLAATHELEKRSLLSVLRPPVAERRAIGSPKVHATTATTAQVHRSSASAIPGNSGLILKSQFQPVGNTAIGLQWWKLAVGGPVKVRSVTPLQATSAPAPLPGPINAGIIAHSQFVSRRFGQIGTQLRRVQLAGGLTIDNYDESTGKTAGGPIPTPGIPGAPSNSGNVLYSQFNDGGFNRFGLQLRGANIGGDLTVLNRLFVRGPDGQPVLPAQSGQIATQSVAPQGAGRLIAANTNTGVIKGSQFNQGGFGDFGLQWGRVKVGGSVGASTERYTVQPGGIGPAPPPRPTPMRYSNLPPVDTTNLGSIRDSQVNTGGFGDIGMQWSKVAVGATVDTTNNGLSVQPEVDNVGPITVDGLIFGRLQPVASEQIAAAQTSLSSPATTAPASVAQSTAGTQSAPPVPLEIDSVNSGQILHSQVNDGGFGDIGVQWLGVQVAGSVAAVHNSLSVQPENQNQGLISISNIQFPSAPSAPLPPPGHGPRRVLSPLPPVVQRDGVVIPHVLTHPTKPRDTTFQVNAATNSGTIRNSQFNDGGFGDIGLQWKHVQVGQNVRLVHNSLSVHPEGQNLAGVNVSNVSFGQPLPAADATAATLGGSRQSSTISPSVSTVDNNRFLSHQQVLDSENGVILQWSGVHRNNGLLIVHNLIQLPSTGTVNLSDIRFLGQPQAVQVVRPQQPQALTQGAPATSSTAATGATITDAATNSGVILKNQFNDGGLGDVGLQWQNVKVSGSVTVVHNTLSVDVTGSGTGPITISNVTFNSGALDQVKPTDQRIISPPDTVSRILANPNNGKKLPPRPGVLDAATNSGILLGGQYSVGTKAFGGHVALQWRNVGIRGSVTIVDNVLSVKTPESEAVPVTIQHVLFA